MRLRFGPAKQAQCIEDCDEGDISNEKSDFEAAEGEENDSQSPNPCVARCMRLRFGPAKQAQCIEDCDEGDISNENSNKKSDFETQKNKYKRGRNRRRHSQSRSRSREYRRRSRR